MEGIDYETGEVVRIGSDSYGNAVVQDTYDPAVTRVDRFRLLNTVRSVAPALRTAKCLRYPRRIGGYTSEGLPLTADVQLWQSNDSGRCHYKNLTVCGSVWTCPVCTAKINEVRRLELKKICEAHERAGGKILMVTKTFSHEKFDDLKSMLGALTKANDRFWRCSDIVRLRDQLGLVGYIRTTEITFGEAHGWHPHYHELWLISKQQDYRTIRQAVFSKWRQFIEKVGLGAPNEDYGVHVRGAADAWGYITKFGQEDAWDYSHEMTKHHVKSAKKDRYTPFTFLRVCRGDFREDETKMAATRARKLFIEYAKAIHGKRQLRYSKGLKALYEIEDLDDLSIAISTDQSSVYLATIGDAAWRKILWSDRKQTSRAIVLALAEKGLDVMWGYIDGLPEPPESYQL